SVALDCLYFSSRIGKGRMLQPDSAKGRGGTVSSRRSAVGSKEPLDGVCRARFNGSMSNAESAYRELIALLKEVELFGSIGSHLGWDERVQMPAKGAEHRSNQSSLLARKVHEQFTSPRIGELLAELDGSGLMR